jgi:hypothetical protein
MREDNGAGASSRIARVLRGAARRTAERGLVMLNHTERSKAALGDHLFFLQCARKGTTCSLSVREKAVE